MKKILILGGGFGGVETYLRLHKYFHPANNEGVHIELINRTNYFTFSPMLHETATGSVANEHVTQPLREILSCCGKDFHLAEVTGIDFDNKIVKTSTGDHTFDILVIALGAEQSFFGVPGAAKHALALKWLPGALDIRNRIIHSFEMASEMHDKHEDVQLRKFLRFVIVGGGATGTELAGQMSDLISREISRFYGDVPIALCELILVHAGDRLLQQLSPKAAARAQKRLEKLGVHIRLNEQVTEVMEDGVILKSGERIESNSVFWTAGTQSPLGNVVPKEYLNERDLLKVTPTMQIPGHDNVFAIGDCTVDIEEEYSYPPTAQAAVQAARVAAANIAGYIRGSELTKKKFVYKGDIIPLGNRFAIYERKPLRFYGWLAWVLRRLVFLQTMYGWGNRAQVAFAWLVALFLPRDTSEF